VSLYALDRAVARVRGAKSESSAPSDNAVLPVKVSMPDAAMAVRELLATKTATLIAEMPFQVKLILTAIVIRALKSTECTLASVRIALFLASMPLLILPWIRVTNSIVSCVHERASHPFQAPSSLRFAKRLLPLAPSRSPPTPDPATFAFTASPI